MRRALLLSLLLLACVSSTLARRGRLNCGVQSNTILLSSDSSGQTQNGAASCIAAGSVLPWPLENRDGRSYRIVKYCYTSANHRGVLDCEVQRALTRWRLKLDSPAFHGTTNLRFEELHHGGPDLASRKPQYCYIVDSSGKPIPDENGKGQWDIANVPGDTLWIRAEPAGAGLASVGYVRVEDPHDASRWGRHFMKLPRDARVPMIVHEFGHVFGMIHEHSRSDRDDYVLFKCENIANYKAALERFMEEHPDVDHDEAHDILCEDKIIADAYHFNSDAYAKFGPRFDEPTGFDTASVMLYETMIGSRPECWRDVQFCALVKYGTTGGRPDRSKPLEVIGLNTDPSDGDARFVQRWYPADGLAVSLS